jgi:hypothetical protein
MKSVLKWTGGVLLTVALLGGAAHAATSEEAHEKGECTVCNFIGCLHAAVFEAFHSA